MAAFALFALAVSSFGGFNGAFLKVAQAATNWDLSGAHVLTMNYEGTDYDHQVNFTQDNMGNLSGTGTSGAYAWTITDGDVTDNSVSFTAEYTATADAVTPLTVLNVDATINPDGSLTGTWSDNYQGGDRSGTVTSLPGVAEVFPGSLAAEDFGVVDYDTGLGQLSGYSAGFGLTDATFEDVQSVVVKLYADDTLLQTNTGTSKIGDEITGNQISSPFDVSGNFDYATDGFWTNTRETEYGQSLAANRVEATVTLANGKVVTAENTNLTGDPSTIFPEPSNDPVTVTILKYVDAAQATGTSANNTDFPMNASWNAENLGGAGSGQFALSENGFNGGPAYQAETSEMTNGSSYSVSEVIDGNTGLACSEEKPYALKGYSYGDSVSEAMAMTPTMTAPNLTNITSDKYIIVWNDDCSTPGNDGTIGGDVEEGTGELAVTSIDVLDSSAVANGNFEDGWKYAFNITVPTDETDLAMKFADWTKTGDAAEIIPAANNIRISSVQADSDSTVMITAADTYSSPALHMNEDLDPSTPGLQVRVIVEVRVPSGTESGSYTTSYGVLTN